MEIRVCDRCGNAKSISEFYRKRKTCKLCRKEYMKEYIKINKDKILLNKKDYYSKNIEIIKEKKKEYNRVNKDIIKERNRQWKIENHVQAMKRKIEYQKSYIKSRRLSDSLYRLKCNLKASIHKAIKKKHFIKKSSTRDILGLDYERLKNYLEYTFFQNYGEEYVGQEVHIDHIIPISSAKTEEEVVKLNHWTNLQYLTPEDNMSKSDHMKGQ
jgi:hypothetical protein